MNSLFELSDFSLPINPEICWRIIMALLHTTWQVACLLAFVLLVSRASRISVHRRFQWSFTCLLIAGCLPFANYFVFGPMELPDSVSTAAEEFDTSGSLTLFRPSELSESAQVQLNTPVADSLLASSTSPDNRLNVVPTGPERLERPEHASANYWKVSLSTLLAILYLLGVAVMLFRLGRLVDQQHRLKSKRSPGISSQSHPVLYDAAKRAAASFGRALQTKISVFEGAGTAFVVGVVQPVILVNVSLLSGLTPSQLQQVLVHELAHVYRLDPITQLAQRIIESILFFHPCVWWISREVSQLRELCCDDLAAKSSSSVEYADTLLHCYQLQKANGTTDTALALPVTGKQPSHLATRIDTLLSEGRRKSSTQSPRTLPVVSRLGLSVLFTATAFIVLSSHSAAVSKVAPQEQADTVKDDSFTWTSFEPVTDSSVEPPHLWFHGIRLELQTEVPADVQVEAMVDPEFCKFAQWHFGDSRSNRVALLIEQHGDQISQVYLDVNRNRIIESHEELKTQIHDGKVWIAELAVKTGNADDSASATRQIAIYPRKNRVRIRTLGFASGEVEIAGETLTVRRIDIDGDGIPVGNRDQLWVDLNSDGEFDAISERFNMADQLNVAEQPYLVRSDQLGHALTLTPQTEIGKLKFNLNLADETATLVKLEGSLRDKNGMLIAVRLTEEPISVPPGKYCMEQLVVEVHDEEDAVWQMELSRLNQIHWIEVEVGQTKVVSLLDGIQFKGKPIHVDDEYSGFQSHVEPTIFTTNGLAITDFSKHYKDDQQDSFFDRMVKIQASDSSVPENEACSGFN